MKCKMDGIVKILSTNIANQEFMINTFDIRGLNKTSIKETLKLAGLEIN